MARFLLLTLLAGGALCGLSCRPDSKSVEDYGPVGSFRLTERSGQTVSEETLRGKVWVASFVFTRCTGGCPQVTATMAALQKKLRLANRDDIRLVTFTVDPERDQPKELKAYADRFHADKDRWLFLTGKREDIYQLLQKGFKVGEPMPRPPGQTEGDEISHSTRLVLVDRHGHIRDYFQGLPLKEGAEWQQAYEQDQERLRQTVEGLTRGPIDFPLLNASLNAAAGVLLLLGYAAIRQRRITLHKLCMLTALAVSTAFLGCYLYYHVVVQHGRPTYFSDRAPHAPAWVATTYSILLPSHIVLAAVLLPLALFVTYQGLRGKLARHVRVARWTLPVWLYVSVTGVVVYWMLYRLYPSP
jgi:protein SCO1/2/putative membrane protein